MYDIATQGQIPGLKIRDWSHQDRAVDAVLDVYEKVPRATVLLPTGAGKTKVGAKLVKLKLPKDGNALLVVPNLDLVSQSLVEYIDELGLNFIKVMAAICSDESSYERARLDLKSTGLDVEVTTDPGVVAATLGRSTRSLTICTYQSLAVLKAAHQIHGLKPWSIAIIDEAHRSAGTDGRSWSMIVHDNQIPCDLRLFMTATRRIVLSSKEGNAVVSMDDKAVYGPVAFRLSYAAACDANVLVDYRVVVPIITNDELLAMATSYPADAPFLETGTGKAVSPEMLVKAVALIKALHQFGAKRTIAYNSTVSGAIALANMLPDVVNLLPSDERPSSVESMCILGDHKPKYRRKVYDKLGSSDPGVMVVTNARVLGEGVNIKKIDSAAFWDPKDSVEKIIQAIGRTLRGDDDNEDKIAILVIPVILGPNETPESALGGSAYAQLWKTISALGAYDDRLDDHLRRVERKLTERRLSPHGSQPGTLQLPSWMKISGVPLPDGFVDAISVKIVKTLNPGWDHEWLENAKCLQEFKDENRHLRIPNGHKWGIPARRADLWCTRQRRLRRRDLLEQWKIDALDAMGFEWEPFDEIWRSKISNLKAYREEKGNLDISHKEVWNKVNIGDLYYSIRKAWRAGLLTQQQISEAEAVDGFIWDPEEERFRQQVKEFQKHAANHDGLPAIGDKVYQAFSTCRVAYRGGKLTKQQIDSLAGIFGPSWMNTRNNKNVAIADPATDPAWASLVRLSKELAGVREQMDPQLSRADLGTRLGVAEPRVRALELQIVKYPPRTVPFFRWIAELGCTPLLVDHQGEIICAITRPGEADHYGWAQLMSELRKRREALGIDRDAVAAKTKSAKATVMLWELLKGFPSVHKALTYIDAIGCALALEKPAAREQTLILPVTAHSRPPQDNDLEEARRHIAELKALLAQADDELEEKSRAVDQSARAVARLEVQLREANTTAAEDMEEALQALDDVERSRAEAEELRRRLFEAGRYEDAVVEHPPGAPTSFAELWDRFSGLQRVLVTADKNKTLQLDRAERGRVWAAKAWNALMALDSYAEVASQGFSGRFREYCMAGIAGSVIWPVKQLALGEAEVTMAKFGAERIFAVPQSVDPSGRRQMKSHLRLDSKGAISPRIYFLDDTKGTTARVIVGYIGPHLTNTKT